MAKSNPEYYQEGADGLIERSLSSGRTDKVGQRRVRYFQWTVTAMALLVIAVGGLTPTLAALTIAGAKFAGVAIAYDVLASVIGVAAVGVAAFILGRRIGQVIGSYQFNTNQSLYVVGILLGVFAINMVAMNLGLVSLISAALVTATGMTANLAMDLSVVGIVTAGIYIGYEVTDIMHNVKNYMLPLIASILAVGSIVAVSGYWEVMSGYLDLTPLVSLGLQAAATVGISGLSSTAALAISLTGIGVVGLLATKYTFELLEDIAWLFGFKRSRRVSRSDDNDEGYRNNSRGGTTGANWDFFHQVDASGNLPDHAIGASSSDRGQYGDWRNGSDGGSSRMGLLSQVPTPTTSGEAEWQSPRQSQR